MCSSEYIRLVNMVGFCYIGVSVLFSQQSSLILFFHGPFYSGATLFCLFVCVFISAQPPDLVYNRSMKSIVKHWIISHTCTTRWNEMNNHASIRMFIALVMHARGFLFVCFLMYWYVMNARTISMWIEFIHTQKSVF